ncbi:MAG: hypothetical protein ABI680_21120, partial [Chthoniobacteraceae bacterium]
MNSTSIVSSRTAVRRLAILSASIAGLLTPSGGARAADFTWNGRTANWNTASEWAGGTAPASDAANVLIFSGTTLAAPYIATDNLGSDFRLNRLALTSADAAANTLATNGTANLLFVADGGVNPTFDQSGAGAMIVDIPFSVMDPLNLTGTGTGLVTLSG